MTQIRVAKDMNESRDRRLGLRRCSVRLIGFLLSIGGLWTRGRPSCRSRRSFTVPPPGFLFIHTCAKEKKTLPLSNRGRVQLPRRVRIFGQTLMRPLEGSSSLIHRGVRATDTADDPASSQRARPGARCRPKGSWLCGPGFSQVCLSSDSRGSPADVPSRTTTILCLAVA